jgi:hypothetical protein
MFHRILLILKFSVFIIVNYLYIFFENLFVKLKFLLKIIQILYYYQGVSFLNMNNFGGKFKIFLSIEAGIGYYLSKLSGAYFRHYHKKK